MIDLLSYEFMQNAVLSGIMASIICGVIGPFIVARRMVFISGGLSHTAFGGLGIAYWLGISPLYGAFLFVLVAAIGINLWEEKIARQDLVIGILWAFGVAVGIIFIYMTPGYVPDLMTFLFGNILTVSRADVRTTFFLLLLVTLPVFIFFKGLVFVTFDEEYAQARSLPAKALRDRAKAALGDRFDLKSLHNAVIGNGNMPLALLGRVVDDYIQTALIGPW